MPKTRYILNALINEEYQFAGSFSELTGARAAAKDMEAFYGELKYEIVTSDDALVDDRKD